ncbi:uncharacterized protein LOC128233627 [Mya arenaria]|uniref:uncharacterized protein LOC128233627 n=1 Tax=Mya arenaria TaxID=6604 RepID=UPI0022DFC7B1|nr:uncharacterized protein LOC128233627 [Mya arenaria]
MRQFVKDKKHTQFECLNISKISYSCIKGRKFAKPENMQFEEKECIVLSVFLKGWIPVGFEKFPDKVGNYFIDVREFQGIDMHGDKIDMLSAEATTTVYKQELYTCTVQGNLKVDGDESTYALTCAHGVLSKSNILELEHDLKIGGNHAGALFKETIAPKCNLGIIKDAFYGIHNQVFVDIAIVELKRPLKNITDEIRKHASDFDIPPLYKLRYKTNFDDINRKAIVMKYGCKSGLTFGLFVERVELENKPDVLVIDGVSKQFSLPGDSGAILLMVDPKIVSNAVLNSLEVDREYLIALNDQDENGSNVQENDHFKIIGIVHGCSKDDTKITFCTRMTPSMSALKQSYHFCS